MATVLTNLRRAALLAALLAGCRVEGTLPDRDPTHCVAKIETEECQDDDSGQSRRMLCNDAGLWTKVETCASPKLCQEGFGSDGNYLTSCSVGSPGTRDACGSDASSGQDATCAQDCP